jgi:phenylalanyl-tRNA synthetase alpha subunit
MLKKKTLQEELDEKKNKIININNKKKKVKNIIDISINNKNINNRQFNPRLPPFNLIKK